MEGLSRRGLLGLSVAAGLGGLTACTSDAVGRGTGHEPSSAPTSQASGTTPSSSAQSASPTRTASVVMSGDLLWHNTVFNSYRTGKPAGDPNEFDFDQGFARMKPIIEAADLAICHEEVPFAKQGGPYLNYPMFAAPPQIAPWIKSMGWDAATLASNHVLDQGMTGLLRTNTLLRDAGVLPVGTFCSQVERDTPVIFTTAAGVKIGLVSGVYGLNGLQLPEGKQWAVSMWDADNLLGQAKRARMAGADIVMVEMHGGDEYQTAPNDDQVKLAKALTASDDVDLVWGEHVHVVQPITQVNGKWVVYGMGNMVAQQPPDWPRTYEGITVRFTFSGSAPGNYRVVKAEYLPTLITSASAGPVQVLPVNQSLEQGTGDAARLRAARQRLRAAVTSLGGAPGLVES